MSNLDPFPRERLVVLLERLPAYLRLTWRLAKDPLLGRARRAALVAAAGYLVSPIDLVPGVIPVLGQLDDLAVAIAAIRFALAGLSPERRRAHLDAVGLTDDVLADDLRSVGAISAWLVRAGARTTNRVARRTGSLAVAGTKAAARTTRSAAGSAARATRRAAGSAVTHAGPAARNAVAKVPRPHRPERLRRAPTAPTSPDLLQVEVESDPEEG